MFLAYVYRSSLHIMYMYVWRHRSKYYSMQLSGEVQFVLPQRAPETLASVLRPDLLGGGAVTALPHSPRCIAASWYPVQCRTAAATAQGRVWVMRR